MTNGPRISFFPVLLLSVSWIWPCFSQTHSDSSAAVPAPSPTPKRVGMLTEFYNESMAYQRYGDNFISSSNLRLGIRFLGIPKVTLELYTIARYGRDSHKDFWNNRFETGIGLRMRFNSKVFLALYSDLVRGYYLKVPEGYPQANDDVYNDFRCGFIFWMGWLGPAPEKKFISLPFKPVGEIYSDISYYHSHRRNIIGYLHMRNGIRTIQIWKMTIAGYLAMYVMKDTKKDFWNNKIEIGPAIWLKPLPGLELKFYIEFLSGRFFGIEGADPNPFSQKYSDRKVGLTFWYGW